ncbi:Kdo domain containing protein [Flavobacterium taihuense]|uniref:Kdo domain containing protein n=1 Tax=Flavobacterium taihuense TaxID=2857508 RepID=A0ABS6XVT9_9FLAO|nr:Kdo domain containing protein [Flavobacterium taihuense]MBW4360782.1 Kdo domain containing protein [Flavobacterium taihuense]
MKYILSPSVKSIENQILIFISEFKYRGQLFGDGKRNTIKLFEIDGRTINIKSFKVPNLINKIAYAYFRKSKARRSFEYATLLLKKGIGTPEPMAYLENYNWIGLKDSYYASEHLQCDLTYRELVEIPNYPDHENILRQFTRFSYNLHQKGIEFKDHSPGNTLIKKVSEDKYEFFLVDLNRMEFHKSMSFELRMRNLCRLTPLKEMVAVMSNEYSKLSGKPENVIFETLWKYTYDFQEKYYRKKRIKAKIKFWK